MQTQYFDLRNTKGQQRDIEEKIIAAAKILQRGGLLGIPTETVYGLAANALDETAVARIFQAKGRPQDNPLILTVSGQQWLPRYCRDIPPLAYVLARKFWPGPLTLILPCRTEVVPSIITAGLNTVAVRCPDHPVTLAIIREAGVPVAAPSANTSGRPSCTTAQDVLEDMDGKIEGVVDGGPCAVGVESTILDLTCQPPRLLRPGGLPLEELERLIGRVEVDEAISRAMGAEESPKAPGMKYRHYAPKAPVTVVTGAPEASAQEILRRMSGGSGIICFDEYAHLFAGHEVHTLGQSRDKLTQAQRVFDALRTFDTSAVTEIFAQCPDSRGLGLAVGNRLKKAAGFHVVEADATRVVLGITGGTGAGKTSALRAIETLGGTVIDCDAIYHRLLDTNQALCTDIANAFPGSFDANGKLNRQQLGQEVFSRKERLAKLNDIVNRHMVPELRRQLETGTGKLYAIDAINLLEGGLNTLCDRTVAVTSPAELRVRRIMARDGITEEYARLRVSAQKPEEFYRGRCDCVLVNDAENAEIFQRQAKDFFERLICQVREERQDTHPEHPVSP